MRIYVKTANISTSTIPALGERNYLILDIDMSERQMYEAVFVLLGAMRQSHAVGLIQEFPELLSLAAKEAA